jgi:hypothetical protein
VPLQLEHDAVVVGAAVGKVVLVVLSSKVAWRLDNLHRRRPCPRCSGSKQKLRGCANLPEWCPREEGWFVHGTERSDSFGWPASTGSNGCSLGDRYLGWCRKAFAALIAAKQCLRCGVVAGNGLGMD